MRRPLLDRILDQLMSLGSLASSVRHAAFGSANLRLRRTVQGTRTTNVVSTLFPVSAKIWMFTPFGSPQLLVSA